LASRWQEIGIPLQSIGMPFFMPKFAPRNLTNNSNNNKKVALKGAT
jgi:hypothetical protein